uniref:Uncharacterized protein n=1 Tax=Timema shepardi TaxID=629360 RepID=A0A7R9AQ94_TIMSH|nr:unnamed protein product [Timema shepardi]
MDSLPGLGPPFLHRTFLQRLHPRRKTFPPLDASLAVYHSTRLQSHGIYRQINKINLVSLDVVKPKTHSTALTLARNGSMSMTFDDVDYVDVDLDAMSALYSSSMASLVLTDSSQLTSDSQHLGVQSFPLIVDTDGSKYANEIDDTNLDQETVLRRHGRDEASGGSGLSSFGGMLPGLINNTMLNERGTMVLGGFSMMLMPMPAGSDMFSFMQNGMGALQGLPGLSSLPGRRRR